MACLQHLGLVWYLTSLMDTKTFLFDSVCAGGSRSLCFSGLQVKAGTEMVSTEEPSWIDALPLLVEP